MAKNDINYAKLIARLEDFHALKVQSGEEDSDGKNMIDCIKVFYHAGLVTERESNVSNANDGVEKDS